MKKKALSIFLILLTTATIAQITGDFYTIDASHSMLSFKARHIGFGSVVGAFETYEGTIYFDPEDISVTSASLIAKVSSINTRGGFRDEVLKKEFFQVEDYPFVIFESKRTRQQGGQYLMVGDLTMGAVTKEIEIPFEHISGPAKDQFSHFRITLGGEIKIDRKEYGLFYRSNDFWDGIVADVVRVEIESGARVYNSIETVFPFPENSIGRQAVEAFDKGGIRAMEQKVKEIFASPDEYNVSLSQKLRGATHLEQLKNYEAAITLLDIIMENSELDEEWKSEFLARKSKNYLKLGKVKLADRYSKEANETYPNALAMEIIKMSR